MSRFVPVVVSAVLLSGCASVPHESLWSRIFGTGKTQDAAAEQKPLSPYEQGKQYLQAGNFGLAIGAFQAELDRNPSFVPALNGLAIAYDRLGRSDVATQYLDKALALDPKSVATLNNLAYLNLTRGETTTALAYARQAQQAASADTSGEAHPAVSEAVANSTAIADAVLAQNKPVASAAEPTPGRTLVEQIAPDRWELHTQAAAPAAGTSVSLTETPRQGTTAEPAIAVVVPSSTLVRISNGTGRNLMARRFSGFLTKYGVTAPSLANASNFNYRRSYIFYNPDQRKIAEDLANIMPVPVTLMEAKKGVGQIEIVLGSDLIAFDDRLREI